MQEYGPQRNVDRPGRVACLACRNRKVRCDREQPRCSNCHRYGQPCTYPRDSLKPGPKIGSVHKRRLRDGHTSPSSSHAAVDNLEKIDNTTPDPCLSTQNAAQSGRISPAQELAIDSRHFQKIDALIRLRHEPLPVSRQPTPSDGHEVDTSSNDIVVSACDELGIKPGTMVQLVNIFFATFTPFRLFREPVFFEKLQHVSSSLQLKALLTPMYAFALKCAGEDAVAGTGPLSASRFAFLAAEYVEAAISECGDEEPPLCLLQALILITHWQIIKGVRGRVWRQVGLCIRLALELGLHCIDAGDKSSMGDTRQWCEMEERRRAYWAIWEMDQFANALKQVTVTINWTVNHVHLPAEDEKWFSGQRQRSCILSPDPVERTKELAATQSKSAKAWYIVLCSLVADAYAMAYNHSVVDHSTQKLDGQDQATQSRALDIQYSVLLNAIRLATLRLPTELKFRYQRLDFGTPNLENDAGPVASIHHQQSVFQLAMIPNAARLVALRPFVLKSFVKKLSEKHPSRPLSANPLDETINRCGDAEKVQSCFEAADALLNIEAHCSESHYLYVNPYHAHASWLAATVQLLRLESVDDPAEKSLYRSRFEVLVAINARFVQHWEMSTVPKQNLDHLAARLKAITSMPRLGMRTRGIVRHRRTQDSTTHPAPSSSSYQDEIRREGEASSYTDALPNMACVPLHMDVAWEEHTGSTTFGDPRCKTLSYSTNVSNLVRPTVSTRLANDPSLLDPTSETLVSPAIPESTSIQTPYSGHTGLSMPQTVDENDDSMEWNAFFSTLEGNEDISHYLDGLLSWSG